MSFVACLACLLISLPDAVRADDPRREPVPSYTNDDLRRVSPHRDETGVASQPAAEDPSASSTRVRPGPRRVEHGEDYWRREADKVANRVLRLERQADALRRRVEARRRLQGVAPYSDARLLDWEREIAELSAEVRLTRDRLEERARREGALPGWLR